MEAEDLAVVVEALSINEYEIRQLDTPTQRNVGQVIAGLADAVRGRTTFAIPDELEPATCHLGNQSRFREILAQQQVKTVDHGEFDMCAETVLKQAAASDSTGRPSPVVLERCRRGGKTFMLAAVADNISVKLPEKYVLQITLNSETPYSDTQPALDAILSRIAFQMYLKANAGTSLSFYNFLRRYTSFDIITAWLERNDVILMIDELNVIPTTAKKYEDMSTVLDAVVGRAGSAVIYTTHHKITGDLLRNQTALFRFLSQRDHIGMSIPRFETVRCVRHMKGSEGNFWCAVLRGRIPALYHLDIGQSASYTGLTLSEDGKSHMADNRQAVFDSVITGDLNGLRTGRDLFRSFAYASDSSTDDKKVYAWAPFMLAQEAVLGKSVPRFCKMLASPELNEAKAFEALVRLAVLIRLMASKRNRHDYVPRHKSVNNNNFLSATEIFYASDEATTLDEVLKEVTREYAKPKWEDKRVLQVVAIPLYEGFPNYDFFLIHRGLLGGWFIAAGYQCKKSIEYPDDDHAAEAKRKVKQSIWVEGRPPNFRRTKRLKGWNMLALKDLKDFLGESMFDALRPNVNKPGECACCVDEEAPYH